MEEDKGLWPPLLFVKALHKSTDCAIIGNQLAKTLWEAEILLKLLYAWMAAKTTDSYVINTNHVSLPHFLLISMQTSNEAPFDTQSQHTDKPSWCVKKTQKNPRTVTMLASAVPLHQRFHIIVIPEAETPGWRNHYLPGYRQAPRSEGLLS